MSGTAAQPVSSRPAWGWMIHRQLDSYPDTAPRVLYLAITVLATITLYYLSLIHISEPTRPY